MKFSLDPNPRMPFLNLPYKEIKAQYSRDTYIDFAKQAPSLI